MKTLVLLVGTLALQQALGADTLVLDLAAAQARAADDNLSAQLSLSQVDEADALILSSKSVLLPQVAITETALRTNDPVTAFGLRLRQERFGQADFALPALNRPAALTGFQTSLTLQQPLFAGGAHLAAWRQAQAGGRQTRLDRAEHLAALRWQVAQAYWGLVLARQSLDALRLSLDAARARVRAAEARYAQQTSPLAELLATQARVAELAGDEAAAAERAENANETLTLLLNLDIQTQILPADTLSAAGAELPPHPYEATALEARPALQAARVQVEAARQGTLLARAGLLPRVDAFARLDLDADTPLDRQGESWTLGGVLTWEVFSGLRTTAALRQARARHQQAQTRLDLAGQEIRRQVRQALRQVETARHRLEAAAQARQYAAERLRLADQQYRQGLVAVAELLDAQDQDTQAQLRRLEALGQLRTGLAYLEYAAHLQPNRQPGSTP